MKKVLSGLAVAAGALALGAPSALAAGTATGVISSASIQPKATTAGSAQDTTASFQFSYSGSDTVKSLSIALPPGFLASPAAVTTPCTSAQLQATTTSAEGCPAASRIASGSAVIDGQTASPATVNVYLMQQAATDTTDVATIGVSIVNASAGVAATTTGTADLIPNSSDQPRLTISVPSLPSQATVGSTTVPVQLNSLTVTFSGTVDNNQFIYLPTSTGAATTNVSATTYGGSTGTATDSFTPTGAGSLPYTPTISASGQATPGTTSGTYNAALLTEVKLPTGDANTSATTINIPSNLQPNPIYLSNNCPTNAPGVAPSGQTGDFTSCPPIGTAAATSVLTGPTSIQGKVYLIGNLEAGTLGMAVYFPAPFNISLIGKISISPEAVAFTNVPDVPLNDLQIALSGGSNSAFLATCASGTQNVSATFTPQNGNAAVTSSAPLNITGCPSSSSTGNNGGGTTKSTPAKVSGGSLSGLGKGKPTLHFKLTAGTAKLKSFKVSLPSGLSFNSKGLKKALKLSAAGSYKVSGSTLTVTLKKPAGSESVSISSGGLKVSRSTEKKAKQHKIASLKVSVAITGSDSKTSKTSFTVKKPS